MKNKTNKSEIYNKNNAIRGMRMGFLLYDISSIASPWLVVGQLA